MNGPGWRGRAAQDLVERARANAAPVLVTGPPGAGKTTLLQSLRDGYARERSAVYLDLLGAASTPERLVLAASRSLREAAPHVATTLATHAAAGRTGAEGAVRALLDAWRDLPAVLLFDEPTEIRSLAYFPGLRDVAAHFGAALQARRAPTILASSFERQSVLLWPELPIMRLAPLTAEDAPDVPAEALAASFGWPRYLRVLAGARDLRATWVREMHAGGALESACRATYESLLLRSRGYGITKALLGVLAENEGLTLTDAVRHLGRSAGAVRDYLEWLLLVDAARATSRRYHYVDGMLRLWVRLHATGTPPAAEAIEAACDEALASGERHEAIAIVGGPERRRAERPAEPKVAPAEAEPEPPRRKPDSLVEID